MERVRLHERVAGTGTATAPLASMLREGIATRVGAVEKIGDGRVVLGDGTGLDFDHLLLAVGSTAVPLPGSVPVGTWEGAEEARAALAGLPGGRTVTVVGGGLTGVETASEIAFGRPDLRVRLVGRVIAPSLSPGARERVRTGLDRLGVEVVEDSVVRIEPGAGEGAVTRCASARARRPPPTSRCGRSSAACPTWPPAAASRWTARGVRWSTRTCAA